MTVPKKKAAKRVPKTIPAETPNIDQEATKMLIASFNTWLRVKAARLLTCDSTELPSNLRDMDPPVLRLKNIRVDDKISENLMQHATAELLATVSTEYLYDEGFDHSAASLFEAIFEYIFPALQGYEPPPTPRDPITRMDLQ